MCQTTDPIFQRRVCNFCSDEYLVEVDMLPENLRYNDVLDGSLSLGCQTGTFKMMVRQMLEEVDGVFSLQILMEAKRQARQKETMASNSQKERIKSLREAGCSDDYIVRKLKIIILQGTLQNHQ